MPYRYDVYGLGNAIVDTEVQVDDTFLTRCHLDKGIMTLVASDTQSLLRSAIGDRAQYAAAGGSAANTMVGIAQFGGTACFVGKVGADDQGAFYSTSLAEAGVAFQVGAAQDEPTGSCLVLVTPDGERTMQTSLSASSGLAISDINEEEIQASQIVYIEGYLYGSPTAAEAAELAMALARKSGAQISLSLSDPGIATLFLDQFRRTTRKFVDIVFCNEHEAGIYAGGGSREERLQAVGEDASLVFMTCGSDGAMIYESGSLERIAGYSVPVLDTTGAGDIFAAGALYGLSRGMKAIDAAKLGTFASARIVTQMGPRLNEPLGEAIAMIIEEAHPLDDRLT